MSRDRQTSGMQVPRVAGRQLPAPEIALDIVEDGGDWSDIEGLEAMISGAANALAGHPKLAAHLPASACLALSDDDAVRQLNGTYRAKDKPTNVLSFPAGRQPVGSPDLPPFIGDIVLAEETVRREARELGIPLEHHTQLLVIHGLLHLLGYDHETEADAIIMEALEAEVLAGLGIPDPYFNSETIEQSS